MSRSIPFDLYLVTDRSRTRGRLLEKVIQMALEAGVRAVQLRERDLPAHELLSLAEQMKALTAQVGATLLVNDRIDVCLAVGADGVHLRADHLPIPVVRGLLGPRRMIGVSCHSIREVVTAEKEGADFVVLGPIYDTPSKRPYGFPLGKEIIRSARACCSIPIFAIGGIQLDRVQEVLQTGASGVAVISSILNAQDVRGSVRDILEALQWKRPLRFAIDRTGFR